MITQSTPNGPEVSRLLNTACDKGSATACGRLADLVENGHIEPTDIEVQELRRIACERGHGPSCHALAMTASDEDQAGWFQLGCEGQDGHSCAQLGRIALNNGDTSAPSWFKAACEMGSIETCVQAGSLYRHQGDLTQAHALFSIACNHGDNTGCNEARPLIFQAHFDDLISNAFNSQICQVWANDPSTGGSTLMVEAQGLQFHPRVGAYANQEIFVQHVDRTIESGAIWTGTSRWHIGGTESNNDSSDEVGIWGQPINSSPSWPETDTSPSEAWRIAEWTWDYNVEHHEVWQPDRGIDALPGPIGYAVLNQHVSSLQYFRDLDTLAWSQPSCAFVSTATVLQAEHCSAVQALLASTLVSTCNTEP